MGLRDEKTSGRVLLLGGNGRLGQMLRRHWPVARDLITQSRHAGADLVFDPSDVAAVRDAAQRCRAVICLAGVVPGRGDLGANVTLAQAAVEGAAGVPVFLASSAAVYGRAGQCHEEDAVQPLSEYGRAKLEMEQTCAGPNVTSLRIGNVAGADAILGGWREGFTLDVLPDGTTPRRSYIGPVSFARAIHALTQAQDLPGVLNIAQPGSVAMGDLLTEADRGWAPRPAPEDVIADVTLNTDRLMRHVSLEIATPSGLVNEWRMDKR